MIYPVLTYSRNAGDFTYNLKELHANGLKAIRLIYKGKSEEELNLRIQEIQDKLNENKLDMDILIDLPGDKPMVGDLGKGSNIVAGTAYHLVSPGEGSSSTTIPVTGFFSHDSFPTLAPGDIISIADDELNLVVKSITASAVVCEALNSFHLTSGRSMSVKNRSFDFTANSDKDILFVSNLKDVPRNIKLVVSFARTAADIQKLSVLQPNIEIIPKIETILADDALLQITDHCHTIMLGRGDLSTSSRPNELFAFQKRLIELCQLYNKELIIGTGLLASIGEGKTPTIAETMDYGYLWDMGIKAFLIAGSNAHNKPLETLQFMSAFETSL